MKKPIEFKPKKQRLLDNLKSDIINNCKLLFREKIDRWVSFRLYVFVGLGGDRNIKLFYEPEEHRGKMPILVLTPGDRRVIENLITGYFALLDVVKWNKFQVCFTGAEGDKEAVFSHKYDEDLAWLINNSNRGAAVPQEAYFSILDWKGLSKEYDRYWQKNT